MVNYQNGKIYKIYCDENDDIYYGSTTQELYMRLRQHKTLKYVSRNIMKNTYHIELVELYPCNNRIELETRERYYIENNKCVNNYIPTRTKKEYEEQHRQQARERTKKWVEKNKEYAKKQNRERKQYKTSFGGDGRHNNNLLRISLDVFSF
tara:strand:+ start:106 stop:558 length:453 start_codon:yes stop_codon:yes gene_type:complete